MAMVISLTRAARSLPIMPAARSNVMFSSCLPTSSFVAGVISVQGACQTPPIHREAESRTHWRLSLYSFQPEPEIYRETTHSIGRGFVFSRTKKTRGSTTLAVIIGVTSKWEIVMTSHFINDFLTNWNGFSQYSGCLLTFWMCPCRSKRVEGHKTYRCWRRSSACRLLSGQTMRCTVFSHCH